MRKDPAIRKKEITDTALVLFHRYGYDTVRVDDILNEIGISKGGFYHHFKSKEDILRDIVRHEVASIFEDAGEAPENVDPLVQLIALFEKGSSDLGADIGVLETLTSFHARTVYLDELESQLEFHLKPFIEALVKNGVETKLFRKVDAAATAEIFVAINNHGNRRAVLKNSTDSEMVAFNATAIDMLGRHLGVKKELNMLVNRLNTRRDK